MQIKIELTGVVDDDHKSVLVSALHDLADQLSESVDALEKSDETTATRETNFPTLSMEAKGVVSLVEVPE